MCTDEGWMCINEGLWRRFHCLVTSRVCDLEISCFFVSFTKWLHFAAHSAVGVCKNVLFFAFYVFFITELLKNYCNFAVMIEHFD